MISNIISNYKLYNLNKDIYSNNIMNIAENLHKLNDYSYYKFDINDMKNTFENFKKKLEIFQKYDGYQKLWINQETDLLIIDDSYYFQKVIRWWYVQNRDYICNYLEKVLEHYKLFIQMINVGLNNPLYKNTILNIHNLILFYSFLM